MGCEFVLAPRNPVLELSLGENEVNCCHGKQVRKGEQVHNKESWGHLKETATVDRYWSLSLVRSAAAGWRRKAYCSSWEGAGGWLFSVTPRADGLSWFLCAIWHRGGWPVVGRKGCSHAALPQTPVFWLNISKVTQHSITHNSCVIAQPHGACAAWFWKPNHAGWWKWRRSAMVCFFLLVKLLHTSEEFCPT